MKGRTRARYLALALMVIVGVICLAIYYTAFALSAPPLSTASATPRAATPMPVAVMTPTVLKTPEFVPTATKTACQIAANEIYIIKPGDSMWKIAGCAFGEPWRWVEICNANPQVTDCNLIHAGNPLIIPRWRNYDSMQDMRWGISSYN